MISGSWEDVFVLFDAVWDPNPKLGPQRAPKPHLHNPANGWNNAENAATAESRSE